MSLYLFSIINDLIVLLSIGITFVLKKSQKIGIFVGVICWLLLSVYFLIEYVVIRASTVDYSVLKQPMSDLGVTACGKDTHLLTSYEICSPYHPLMNVTFTLVGIVIFMGAFLLEDLFPKVRRIRIATILFAIYGISFGISGIVPADSSFWVHTISAIPGMFVQIPALLLIARTIKIEWPGLHKWTFFILLVNASTIVLILLPFISINLPGGLLQRMLFGSVFVWMSVTAIVLAMKKYKQVR